MTYMVGVDNTGHVLNVELLVFREARGSEVRTKALQRAVRGQNGSRSGPPQQRHHQHQRRHHVGSLDDAGIKRVLVLVDEFYLKPAGLGQRYRRHQEV